jgi:hypothetical protein
VQRCKNDLKILLHAIVYNKNMSTANTSPIENTNISQVDLAQLMKNIESEVNPKTLSEGVQLLSKPDELVSRMQSGANQFTEQTGRPMTYSEMRQMYG